jgi:hypothetical protein
VLVNKIIIGIGVVLAVAIFGTGYVIVDRSGTTALQLSRVEKEIEQQGRQIDRLRSLIAKVENQAATRSQDATTIGAPPVDPVSPSARATTPVAASESHSESFDEAASMASDPGPVDQGDPLSLEFEREWGQSNWGRAAADAIEAAVPEHPFFSRYGGELATDCREQTCRVEWIPPLLSDLPEQDREQLLSMARYEMLALAARNASEVGEMTTEWAGEGESLMITTTFKKSKTARR